MLGIPGSGKSTVAKILAKSLEAEHLAASTVLREYAASHPDESKSWAEFWRAGASAPDEQVLPVLWGAFVRMTALRATILDGYPRTDVQLQDFLDRGGWIDLAAMLHSSEDVALNRIMNRGATSGRVDDVLQVARRRLDSEKLAQNSLLSALSVHVDVTVIDTDSLNPRQIADLIAAQVQ
ncbi:nucleoside monophosphate kinase [Streptomyces sp. NPDC058620]|uniref:nucleoside monophosphate kinase n=1 Tax=Streptomyces sp. NPDC058620 TaxID=3346560 RepID=UPI003663F6B2